MNDVVIIDAGGANLGSVRAAFARLGVEPELSRDPARIAAASKLVLPGVGAAAPVMRILRETGIDAVLRASTTPLLGICIGMQVLFERSEEGDDQDTVHFTRAGVKGTLVVDAQQFELRAQLGLLLGAFKDRIESEISDQIDALLAKKPAKAAPKTAKPATKPATKATAKSPGKKA